MKPSIPKGTRDFSPEQVNKRNYIIDIIRKAFVKYGFQPIETPAMENLTTLTGKYGDEGDQLLFKILKNGDFTTDIKTPDNYKKLAFEISEKGLRYDLTVPFARYVVMHQNEISFPFRRYQIQPVWRGDRPQRGRYQEFWQCDADVVGSNSLLNEVELSLMIDEVFKALGFGITLKLNNRKILAAMAEVAGIADKMMSMTIAIDKLDKIGIDGVRREMSTHGIGEAAIAVVEKFLAIRELDELKPLFANSELGLKGIAEMETILDKLKVADFKNTIELDFTLARGLNYYTGTIFEVKANGVQMGSILGGGRYDDLTGLFGLKNLSGVGISFGLDRIYDVMNELDLFPKELGNTTKLLFVSFDQASFDYAFMQLLKVRAAGIACELYPEPAKIQKQMTYANNRQVPYVVLVGETECQTAELTVKNMAVGEQSKMTTEQLIDMLKS